MQIYTTGCPKQTLIYSDLDYAWVEWWTKAVNYHPLSCCRVSLNTELKDVKSPHTMSKPTWQRNHRQLYALGTLRLQPGRACTTRPPALEQRPGEGKRQARGRLHPGAAQAAGRGSRARSSPGRAPSLGLSGGGAAGPASPSPPHCRRQRPRARAYLLRLLPQRDAHGPEARLELGNVHPPVFVEVQFSEEVGVPGVAIPVPVAGGRRQNEASQELEHVGAV